ncbi:CBO0543 family protein [Heyndrickxia acidicola]|uniref:CBO0543 family protein n=1 Tax=Heyndrickxia acidicola TaxID=209389 RepID=UPI00266B7015|nr:CBO0543 family protein [Heyndrickxia acidicola]
MLYYNQWTLNSKPLGIFLKILPFAIPEVIIETIAERKSNLITWKKGWTWYHSFTSLAIKFLLCRLVIAVIRKINNKTLSIS